MGKRIRTIKEKLSNKYSLPAEFWYAIEAWGSEAIDVYDCPVGCESCELNNRNAKYSLLVKLSNELSSYSGSCKQKNVKRELNYLIQQLSIRV